MAATRDGRVRLTWITGERDVALVVLSACGDELERFTLEPAAAAYLAGGAAIAAGVEFEPLRAGAPLFEPHEAPSSLPALEQLGAELTAACRRIDEHPLTRRVVAIFDDVDEDVLYADLG